MNLYFLFALPSVIVTLVTAGVAVYLWPRRNAPEARTLMMLMAVVAAWCLTYALEIQTPDLAAKIFWSQWQYPSVVLVAPLFLLFALRYGGHSGKLTRIREALLFVLPAVSLILAWTNDGHHFIWPRYFLDTSGPIPMMGFTHGPGYWFFFVAVSYSMVAAGLGVLFHAFLFTKRLNRTQMVVMIAGVAGPLGANLIYNLGIHPMAQLDLTSFSFALTGPVLVLGLYRYNILNLIPMARETVFEELGDAVLVFDPENRLLDQNRAAGRLLGTDVDGIRGSPPRDVFRDWPELIEDSTGPEGTVERVRPTADGRRYFDVTLSSFVGDRNERGGRLMVLRETTEKIRMEARLRTAHNQLQTMIDAMPSALVGLAPDGTITHWNTAAGLMFGLEAAEALGRPLTDIRALFPEPAGLIEECLKNRRPTASRRFNRVTEGSTSHYELLVYPLDSGDETGAVIRVDDATERVRLQEIMVQTEKMMSVGGLAAGMAHEINNPLGGVVLGAENILRRLSPDLEPNRRAALAQGTDMTVITGYLEQRKVVPLVEGVLESGLRAARIVADMLAFSRSGHSEFTPTLLNELLDRTVALAANDYDLKKQYDFRHIEIVREYDPGLGPVVCQVNKIEQVILNLLKNAAQALAGRPRPAGEPPRITLRTGVEGDLARVEVGDNGPGMDETTRRRVFEPFFTTKPVGVGTGLGLSISYFIITDNHRGRLSVDSQPGEGSRFIIHLPFSGPGSRRAGKGSDPPPGEDE